MNKIVPAVVVSSLLLFGCETDGVTVYAPPELAKGAILIDGKLVGHFQATQREYRWIGWARMRGEIMNAPRSETIAKLPPFTVGPHELEIVKDGYQPIHMRFSYTSGRAAIEINDALVKPVVPGPRPGQAGQSRR